MDDEKEKTKKGELHTALTRREWLHGFGPAVVLSNFPDALQKALQEHQAPNTVLPAGLYAPSFDHLRHVLSNENAFLSIPPDSETEYVRPQAVPFEPRGFSAAEFPVVRRLTEIILGEDMKSSQKGLGRNAPTSICDEVAEWIDLIVASAAKTRAAARNLTAEQRALAVAYFGSEEPVRELEILEPERICREGLAWLEEESHRRFTKSFLDAGSASQVELIQAISDARPEKSVVHAGTHLFDFLKVECIRGFYTSRVGLKELDYKGNTFYGEPPGCSFTEKSGPGGSKTE
ncbi:MAG TPA: gluconate 2-dehydrogenase subunit 3 family protein [Candidatus Acidoferrum sp.]|nr:gluconate 2-dehydrogenase subunit 3 family protein [Candidatus Acidoferrum sp.]